MMLDMIGGAYLFLLALVCIGAVGDAERQSTVVRFGVVVVYTIVLLIGVRLFLLGWGR